MSQPDTDPTERRAAVAAAWVAPRVKGCPACGGNHFNRPRGLSHLLMSELPAPPFLAALVDRMPLLLLTCEGCAYVMPFALAEIEWQMRAASAATPAADVVAQPAKGGSDD